MAVLVLESGRARTEDLNEKLRRLALITAEATQSLRVHETLEGVLRHLVASLEREPRRSYSFSTAIAIPAVAGAPRVGWLQRPVSIQQGDSRIRESESWARDAFEKNALVRFLRAPRRNPAARLARTKRDCPPVSSCVYPAKERPLGPSLHRLLRRRGPSSATKSTSSSTSANLLGLTVQNVALIEAAATARRQWLDTFDSIDDLILVHSPDGRILRANRSLAWHLGLEPDLSRASLLRELLKHGEMRWAPARIARERPASRSRSIPSFGGHFLVTNSNFHDSEGKRSRHDSRPEGFHRTPRGRKQVPRPVRKGSGRHLHLHARRPLPGFQRCLHAHARL